MGLKILLKNEKGTTLESVADSKKLLNRLLPSFDDQEYCCIRFIDRYGDTVFNGLQMKIFLDEWNLIIDKAIQEEEIKLVLSIKELAIRCQSTTHLYLCFYGD